MNDEWQVWYNYTGKNTRKLKGWHQWIPSTGYTYDRLIKFIHKLVKFHGKDTICKEFQLHHIPTGEVLPFDWVIE